MTNQRNAINTSPSARFWSLGLSNFEPCPIVANRVKQTLCWQWSRAFNCLLYHPLQGLAENRFMPDRSNPIPSHGHRLALAVAALFLYGILGIPQPSKADDAIT